MSRTLQTSSGDLVVSGNRLQVVDATTAALQKIEQRLLTSRGDWRYDLRDGVPYIQEISGKVPLGVVRSILRQVLLDTPGVDAVLSLELDLNTTTRELAVTGVVSYESTDVGFANVYVGSLNG